MIARLALLVPLVGCGGAPPPAAQENTARETSPLEHAVHTFEEAVERAPLPNNLLMLAMAYERVDDLERARATLARPQLRELPENARGQLEALQARLDSRSAGAPHQADPALEERIVEWARRVEERRDRDLHCCMVQH